MGDNPNVSNTGRGIETIVRISGAVREDAPYCYLDMQISPNAHNFDKWVDEHFVSRPAMRKNERTGVVEPIMRAVRDMDGNAIRDEETGEVILEHAQNHGGKYYGSQLKAVLETAGDNVIEVDGWRYALVKGDVMRKDDQLLLNTATLAPADNQMTPELLDAQRLGIASNVLALEAGADYVEQDLAVEAANAADVFVPLSQKLTEASVGAGSEPVLDDSPDF